MNGASYDDPSAPAEGNGQTALSDIAGGIREASVGADQFRLLAEHIPILCWMAEADGSISWYNRRWHDYCGSTPEQMAGWGWQSVHDPDRLPAVMQAWTGCIDSGLPFEMVFPLRGGDGIFRPFLTRAQPARDAAGEVTGWFGVNTEIGAQIDLEEQLRAANLKTEQAAAEREAILGQLIEGVIVTDGTGVITFVNDAATRLHGVARLDVAPDAYSETYGLFTEDGAPFPPRELPLARAILDGETVTDARWRIRRPDGTEVLALGNARPLTGPDGELAGAVLTVRDDTARHAAEEALADAVRTKDALLHEVNHRVKNSLQIVTSLLMVQANQAKSPDLKQGLLEARARIGVVAAVHHRLYSTSYHDRVDLADYLGGLGRETLGALDADGHIDFRFTSTDHVVVPLDKAVPVALIVSELLTNSVKYAFDGEESGRIWLDVAASEAEIVVSVADDGHGVPAGFAIDGSQGLGMRIVTALVRQLRATLVIEPVTRGAKFVLRFQQG